MPLTSDQIKTIQDKFYWAIDEGRFYILEKSALSNLFTSPTANGTNEGVRVYYTSKASHFTASTNDAHLETNSEIPSQFHEALCLKVISDAYKIPGDTYNLQNAQYFDQQYELQIREAKKFAKRNHTSTGHIIPVSY